MSSTKAVFLSYASQDAEAARRICEALRASGIEVWVDQSELRGASLGIEFRYGGKFDKAIEKFGIALSLSPDEIGTHYRTGETLLLKGNAAAALTEFQREPLDTWRMIGLPFNVRPATN